MKPDPYLVDKIGALVSGTIKEKDGSARERSTEIRTNNLDAYQ